MRITRTFQVTLEVPIGGEYEAALAQNVDSHLGEIALLSSILEQNLRSALGGHNSVNRRSTLSLGER